MSSNDMEQTEALLAVLQNEGNKNYFAMYL